jgi:MOSC domain-containing protein YiiM
MARLLSINVGLAGHGGEHRAVMVYQIDSYRFWEAQLGRKDFSFGQFGENFTVEGLPDNEVCAGDRYRIGSALFEVTQPRVTCYRVGIRMAEPAMAALLVSHHRPGFYFRVLEEGEVGAGDEITKVADGPERITVAGIDALLYLPNPSHEQLKRSLRVPALSPGWKASLKALADQKSSDAGNPGLKASSGPPPAWPGFRQLRVASVDREAANVVSLSIEQTDGAPLPPAMLQSFCSVPASGQPPYSPCCARCPPRRHVVRSGGFTERVTAQSTRLQKSLMTSCKLSRTAEATLSTASPIQAIKPVSIMTRLGM